jgi:hypothetical protein
MNLSHLSENDKIIAQRQKIHEAKPEYGSGKHYIYQKARNTAFNKEIQEAYAEKRLFQIFIEDYIGADIKKLINSPAHFRGMVVELLVMNFLLKVDAASGFKNMPQFSTDSFDNGRDIIVRDHKIECKGETPVFIANGASFHKNQKRKVLGCDHLFVAFYGSLDGEENWFCRYLWYFDMRVMPETEWDDYSVGTVEDPIHRFGHNMGADKDDCTPWAKPVMKIPDKIYKALIEASDSLYKKDDNFRKGKVTRKITWKEFIDKQRRKHGR